MVDQSRQPRVAALLGWILPGAGHVYAGHASRGAIAFAAVMGIFAAGYALVHDRIFGFSAPMDLLPIPFVPYHAIPEIGNLAGAMFANVMLGTRDFDTERMLRLPRDLEHVGLTLTACSGVLNLLFVAEAHWLAQAHTLGDRATRFNPGLAALLSWVVPGLGHMRAGQRGKGLVLLGSVLFLFLGGLALSDFTAADRAQLYWWWAGQIFFAGGTVPATMLLGPLHVARVAPFVDLGITLCCVAGLMNLVVMVDAYTVTEDLALAAATGPAARPSGG